MAIKILRAEAGSSRESEVLGELSGCQSRIRAVQLPGVFRHQGPNGLRACLVLELLGPTLLRVLSDYSDVRESLDPQDILAITRQLLQSVATLHRQGYAHGGMLLFPGR